ncbi:MAG: hypothetical protein IKY77_04490 [Methanocorpusculaceae archaeon]|nr:hypothetical protein [Methanocorpusculaceae archaeon]
MKTWRNIAELADKERLSSLINEERTPLRIARRIGCSRESVKNAMKHHGLHTKKFQIEDEMKKRLRL